jgi:type IV secretory pathway TraG/TraD family ATPase VirD4
MNDLQIFMHFYDIRVFDSHQNINIRSKIFKGKPVVINSIYNLKTSMTFKVEKQESYKIRNFNKNPLKI